MTGRLLIRHARDCCPGWVAPEGGLYLVVPVYPIPYPYFYRRKSIKEKRAGSSYTGTAGRARQQSSPLLWRQHSTASTCTCLCVLPLPDCCQCNGAQQAPAPVRARHHCTWLSVHQPSVHAGLSGLHRREHSAFERGSMSPPRTQRPKPLARQLPEPHGHQTVARKCIKQTRTEARLAAHHSLLTLD